MNAQDATTFTEHRQRLRKDLDRVRRTGRPLLITNQGRPDAVVLSPDTYDRLVADAELSRSIDIVRRSMAEFDRGKGIPASRVFAKVRKQLRKGGA